MNLIVIEKRKSRWISSNTSTNCPSPLSMRYKDKVSRNIVGGRELLPEVYNFMEQLFLMFSFLLILATVMTISSTNPIQSVFWLVLVFTYTAASLLCIGLEFLALILIIIYIGAITILFLFVIMMLDVLQLYNFTSINNIIPTLLIIFGTLIVGIWFKIGKSVQEVVELTKLEVVQQLTDLQSLSLTLYNEFSLFLLLISLLLLVAMVAAIILTLDLQSVTQRQLLSNQHHRNNSWI